MKKCIYCENEIEDQAKFCNKCGKEQVDNSIKEETNSVPPVFNDSLAAPPQFPQEKKEWHLHEDGETKGPFTKMEILKKRNQGEIDEFSFLWKSGMREWKSMKDIPELNENEKNSSNKKQNMISDEKVIFKLGNRGFEMMEIIYAVIAVLTIFSCFLPYFKISTYFAEQSIAFVERDGRYLIVFVLFCLFLGWFKKWIPVVVFSALSFGIVILNFFNDFSISQSAVNLGSHEIGAYGCLLFTAGLLAISISLLVKNKKKKN